MTLRTRYSPDRRGSALRATARAGSNIAFIKYWGVADAALNLPLSNSLSMTLADAYTTTSVEWDTRGVMAGDEVTIDGKLLANKQAERISRHLERIRVLASVSYRARVVSQNNFPMASGIASSASGFAALTVAACSALGLERTPAQLSAIARRGSGSAARSLFGGFVEWEKGRDDATSIARQVQPPDYWELLDIVAIVSAAEKAVSSESGHLLAVSSPFNMARIDQVELALTEARSAIATRDLPRLGVVIERDALAMHAVMMTSTPSLLYWQPGTLEILQAVRQWREQEKIEVYFTIDAGPNVHLICEAAQRGAVTDRLRTLPHVQQVLVSKPGGGPILLDTHLF
jgi:diphosphomevalonate decarboxylase